MTKKRDSINPNPLKNLCSFQTFRKSDVNFTVLKKIIYFQIYSNVYIERDTPEIRDPPKIDLQRSYFNNQSTDSARLFVKIRYCLNTTYGLKKGESRWTGYYCYCKFTNKPFQRLEGKNTISIKNEFPLAGSQPLQLEKCYLFENHHYSNYKEVRRGTFPSNTSNESQRVYAL